MKKHRKMEANRAFEIYYQQVFKIPSLISRGSERKFYYFITEEE